MGFSSGSGLTALDLCEYDAEEFDDIELTIFGKKRILKILTEVKTMPSSS